MLAAFLSSIPRMVLRPTAAPDLRTGCSVRMWPRLRWNVDRPGASFGRRRSDRVPVREAVLHLPERMAVGSIICCSLAEAWARVAQPHASRGLPRVRGALPRLTILHQAGAKHADANCSDAAKWRRSIRWQVRAFSMTAGHVSPIRPYPLPPRNSWRRWPHRKPSFLGPFPVRRRTTIAQTCLDLAEQVRRAAAGIRTHR